jgi:hypothetical protein
VTGAGEIGPGTSPSRSPEVAEAILDGEAVLYHERYRTVCVLNPSATVIWSHLDGSGDLATIASELASVFGVRQDVVLGDVLDAVRDLGRRGLLAGVEADARTIEALLLAEPEPHLPRDG